MVKSGGVGLKTYISAMIVIIAGVRGRATIAELESRARSLAGDV